MLKTIQKFDNELIITKYLIHKNEIRPFQNDYT